MADRIGVSMFATALLASAILASPGHAVPPPPPLTGQPVALPANRCRVPLSGTVRAYAQPLHMVTIAAPTVLRILADGADPALLIDLEHADGDADARPVVAGVGLSGGDVRIAIPDQGRYRLRVLMNGDAARKGRAIDYKLSLSNAMESGAAECNPAR